MAGLYYYPYSTTYLVEHMQRISRGIVLLGLFAISATIAVVGIYAIVAPFIN